MKKNNDNTLPITDYKKSKEIIRKEINIESPPEKLNENNVIYWSRHYKEIIGLPKGKAIAGKARLFIKNNCIRYDNDMETFYCDPIKGYNKSIYTIKKINGRFICNCQFFQKVCLDSDMLCSHVLAVYLWLKIFNWNKQK